MNNKLIAPILVTASTFGLCGSALGQQPLNGWDGRFQKRIYIGIGGGVSQLQPDTSDVQGIDVDDDIDAAANVTLGFDLTRRLSFELQYADLGSATLTGGAEVDYSVPSVSGLLYFYNASSGGSYADYDGLDTRTGFSIFGRLGGGQLDTSATGVDAERVNDFQVVGGLGVEWGFRFGLTIRGEFTSYDSDARYTGLSLLYRFGRLRAGSSGRQGELPSLPPPQPISTLPPPSADLPLPSDLPPPNEVPAPPELPNLTELSESPTLPDIRTDQNTVASTASDADGDGIADADDQCSATAADTPVDEKGCAVFGGVMEGVNFLTGSDTLTGVARDTLDNLVTSMEEFPDVRISVNSHTDSQGDSAVNLELSKRRALAVVRYLTAQGVNLGRFEARAFGERKPIADNSTPEGRQLNRRVEVNLL